MPGNGESLQLSASDLCLLYIHTYIHLYIYSIIYVISEGNVILLRSGTLLLYFVSINFKSHLINTFGNPFITNIFNTNIFKYNRILIITVLFYVLEIAFQLMTKHYQYFFYLHFPLYFLKRKFSINIFPCKNGTTKILYTM